MDRSFIRQLRERRLTGWKGDAEYDRMWQCQAGWRRILSSSTANNLVQLSK